MQSDSHPSSLSLPVEPVRVHWPSVLQFGLSVLAIFSLWGITFSATLAGIMQLISGSGSKDETLALFLFAASTLFSGLLLVPSAAYSFSRLISREIQVPASVKAIFRPTRLIFLLPAVLLLGYWVAENSSLNWLLLPPLHVLAVGLPILWLVGLAIRDLPAGSPQRAWGILGSGIVIAPLLIFALELLVLVAIIFFALLVISANPDLIEEITALTNRLGPSPPSPEVAAEVLGPYLANPTVLFTIVAYAAVLVPLVEELLKPIGAWMLVSYSPTPAEGFTAGVLSGAGFALVESLGLTSGGQMWVALVFARIGTGAIHIFTAGLMGWALALAWQENRYIRLGASFLIAVLIHGLWNGLTLANVGTTLSEISGTVSEAGMLTQLGRITPAILVFLALGAFLGLLWANRSLRQSLEGVAAQDEAVV